MHPRERTPMKPLHLMPLQTRWPYPPGHCVGLCGQDSRGLAKIIPKAAMGIRPQDLPGVFAEMLQAQAAC